MCACTRYEPNRRVSNMLDLNICAKRSRVRDRENWKGFEFESKQICRARIERNNLKEVAVSSNCLF